jgi:hypothetical protein
MINGASVDIGYKVIDNGNLLLSIPPERQPELVTILNRALNCWPDCPPEWKHLADIVQHGAPLQNYYDQPAPRNKAIKGQPTPT